MSVSTQLKNRHGAVTMKVFWSKVWTQSIVHRLRTGHNSTTVSAAYSLINSTPSISMYDPGYRRYFIGAAQHPGAMHTVKCPLCSKAKLKVVEVGLTFSCLRQELNDSPSMVQSCLDIYTILNSKDPLCCDSFQNLQECLL